MPINLVTGQPRNGKTLWTIWHVKALAEKDSRTVYYSGIKNLKVPGWVELDKPEDWVLCPDNAIIVIDECQRVFRPRFGSSKTPQHVEALETHGHHGLDLFLITQHPDLVEQNVRSLVQTHRHIKRLWGANAATVHEWEEICRKPDVSRSDSVRTTWRYPKDVFEVYDSASVHTVKRRVPMRLLMGLAFLVLGPLLIGKAIFWRQVETPAAVASSASGAPGVARASAQKAGASGATSVPALSFLDMHRPRVPGLPHTAPVYDGVTSATVAPYPEACLASAARCQCYTAQGTRIDMVDELCRQIVEHGFFNASKAPAGGVAKSAPALVRSGTVAAPVM